MNANNKLNLIATQMHLELAEEVSVMPRKKTVAPCGVTIPHPKSETRADRFQNSHGVFNAVVPGGKTIPLLKTMMTTACERNCYYCPFRAGRNYRRTTFKPEEMAKTFADMHQAKLVNGLFLSSGIIRGGVRAQDKMLDTIDIMRRKHHFRGYIHLKIMPGAEKAQVERAMQLADRLSVNLEAPTSARLARLAPKKILIDELLRPLQWIEEIRQSQPAYKSWNGKWPSSVTQFVVGAVGDTDVELMQATSYLYNKLRLTRTYFSAFSPIVDTPLAELPATPSIREHRLYQASFLLRDYGFEMEEMPFDNAGNLPLDHDPKKAWAEENLAEMPVELNQADRHVLLRIPGIGAKSANAILEARRVGRLRFPSDLKKIGVKPGPALPYILLDGQRPLRQMRLF